MGDGGRGGEAMQREIKETEVTSPASREPCQQERCAGMSEIGQTTRGRSEVRGNKDWRQSSSQCTACMRLLLLCHTQTAPPAEGATDAGSTWHTWAGKRPVGVSGEGKRLLSLEDDGKGDIEKDVMS